jgi:hypothetical protein
VLTLATLEACTGEFAAVTPFLLNSAAPPITKMNAPTQAVIKNAINMAIMDLFIWSSIG